MLKMKPLAKINFAGGFLFLKMYFNRDGQDKKRFIPQGGNINMFNHEKHENARKKGKYRFTTEFTENTEKDRRVSELMRVFPH